MVYGRESLALGEAAEHRLTGSSSAGFAAAWHKPHLAVVTLTLSQLAISAIDRTSIGEVMDIRAKGKIVLISVL